MDAAGSESHLQVEVLQAPHKRVAQPDHKWYDLGRKMIRYVKKDVSKRMGEDNLIVTETGIVK